MKRIVLAVAMISLIALGGQVAGEMCTIDAVPAATLLLPYFEVDIDDPNGVNTLFSINNASAAPTVAHVVLWTDWSIPTIDFDIYLTGYDVQTVSLYDVFNGTLPITADAIRDPADTISPHGGAYSDNPAWDTHPIWGNDIPGCNVPFPYPNPAVTGSALDRLRNGHTGNSVAAIGGGCMGASHGDGLARGYITVDNSNECSLVLDPAVPGYFVANGTGLASNVNQLWGDFFYVDTANNFAQGENLVHIEAENGFDDTVGTGYTFYGRYTLDGRDNREPLGSLWGSRYLNGGAFDGGTNLIVWRDSTDDTIAPVVCGTTPRWFPLNETQVVAFDEQEDAVEICFLRGGGIISPPDDPTDPVCFPYETGRYQFGEGDLAVPYTFGWTFLNLNTTVTTGVVTPWTQLGLAQSYVMTTHSALGLFSVGYNAIELASACTDSAADLIIGSYYTWPE